jgi:hypothetical protein
LGIIGSILDMILGIKEEDYLLLTCSQEQRVRDLRKIDDAIRIETHFRVITPGTGPRLMYVTYQDIYKCTIGGDQFNSKFEPNDYEKIKWLDDRLRDIFANKEL